MTTYPLAVAMRRADYLGYEPTELPVVSGVATLRHHRTKRLAALHCNPVDENQRYSDCWWLDTGDEQITLVGQRELTDA